ncbi:MAG: hypothetical protein WBD46_05055 [Acidobacteriaceae bacterium]
MKHRAQPALVLLVLLASSSGAQQFVATASPAPPESGSAMESVSGEPAAAAIMPVAAPRPALQPSRFALVDWSLLGSFGALRFLDYKTTEKCASDPRDFKENELPESLVRNKPAFAAFESGTVALDYFAYRWVARRHRALARVGQIVNVGSIAWAVGGNYAALVAHFPQKNSPLTP